MEWIKKQIEWLKGFWSEENGNASSKRLISFLVVLSFLYSYLKASFYTNKVEDVPMTWAMLIAGIIGLTIWSNIVDGKK